MELIFDKPDNLLLTYVKVFIANFLHHSFIHCTGTNQFALVTLLRISKSFIEKAKKGALFRGK